MWHQQHGNGKAASKDGNDNVTWRNNQSAGIESIW